MVRCIKWFWECYTFIGNHFKTQRPQDVYNFVNDKCDVFLLILNVIKSSYVQLSHLPSSIWTNT